MAAGYRPVGYLQLEIDRVAVAELKAHFVGMLPQRILIENALRIEAIGTCVFDGSNAKIRTACNAVA